MRRMVTRIPSLHSDNRRGNYKNIANFLFQVHTSKSASSYSRRQPIFPKPTKNVILYKNGESDLNESSLGSKNPQNHGRNQENIARTTIWRRPLMLYLRIPPSDLIQLQNKKKTMMSERKTYGAQSFLSVLPFAFIGL